MIVGGPLGYVSFAFCLISENWRLRLLAVLSWVVPTSVDQLCQRSIYERQPGYMGIVRGRVFLFRPLHVGGWPNWCGNRPIYRLYALFGDCGTEPLFAARPIDTLERSGRNVRRC